VTTFGAVLSLSEPRRDDDRQFVAGEYESSLTGPHRGGVVGGSSMIVPERATVSKAF